MTDDTAQAPPPAQDNAAPPEQPQAQPEQPKPNGQAMSVDAFIMSWLQPSMVILMQGLLFTLQRAPIQRILPMMAGVMGRLLSEATGNGDLSPILQIRKACREEFLKGLNSVTPQPVQQPPGAPQTAVKPKLILNS
jgi:hypothetical protein